MFPLIRKITLGLSFFLLILMIYDHVYVDHSEVWKHYQKPELALYASLDREESILEELQPKTRYESHKVMDYSTFRRPNIFNRDRTF